MKKFKLLPIAIASMCCASFFVGNTKPINLINSEKVSFDDKVIFSLSSVVTDGSVDSESETEEAHEGVRVTLKYEEGFSCDHDENIDSYEDLLIHRKELKDFYTEYNRGIIESLDLTTFQNVEYSNYGPFIEYDYENIESFMGMDYSLLRAKDSQFLERVVVDNGRLIDYAQKNDALLSAPAYSFSQALSDVGIPTNKQFTGLGIKIGSIELGGPNDYSNLTGKHFEVYGNVKNEHAFLTSSIYGGTSGIASDAEIYFAAVSADQENSEQSYSYLNCCNWLLEKGVQLINVSSGMANGTYDIFTAYFDYLVRTTKVTFINSAGNIRDLNTMTNDLIFNTSLGVNVISVASNDSNWAMSVFNVSQYVGIKPSWIKPTLTAPGGALYGIPNISGLRGGTSCSAPFVTGIVALLMEEFPILQTHPEMVMALLSNNCQDAMGQTGMYDSNSGFGIVNYQKARSSFSETYSCPIVSSQSDSGIVFQKKVTIPIKQSIRVTACSLYNSAYSNTSGTVGNVNYTTTKVKIVRNDTGETVQVGRSVSNFSFDIFANYTDTTEFTLYLYLNSNKVLMEPEACALNFYIK